MTPDSDTYTHILLNGALWCVVFFGIPTVVAIRRARRRWGSFRSFSRALDNGDANIRRALEEIEDYANTGVDW